MNETVRVMEQNALRAGVETYLSKYTVPRRLFTRDVYEQIRTVAIDRMEREMAELDGVR